MLSKRCFKLSESAQQRIRRWFLLVEILVVGLTGCASFDYLTRVTEEFPKAKQCGKCHIEIYKEWSESDHAAAYVNPHFRQMTGDYVFSDCLSCHAPQPTVSDQPPAVRSMDRAEGITCVSCHLEQGKLSGPLEPTGKIAPHPIGVKPEFYNDSIICGVCHEGTYSEWKSAVIPDKKSCQHCHMSPIKRKVTQASGGFSKVIVSFEKETELKRHDFTIQTTAWTEPPFTFELYQTDSDIELILKNNLPHALPTGDFGYRILLLEIFAIDPQRKMTFLERLEIAKELGNAIPTKETARWQLNIPLETKALHVHLTRHSYEEDPVLDLVDIEIPLQ